MFQRNKIHQYLVCSQKGQITAIIAIAIKPAPTAYLLVSAFGYGYLDEVPASYVLRYFKTLSLLDFYRPIFVLLDPEKNVGFQDFWQAVAAPS